MNSSDTLLGLGQIFEDAPVFVDDTTGYVFPSTTSDTVTFTIPAALPSGE